MLTIEENRSDCCRDPGAAVRDNHLGLQEFPSLLAFSVTLDEVQELPVSLLRDLYSTQGRLPAYPLATHFEVGSVNDEISDLLGEGPVQSPDQLLLDRRVHPAHLGRAHGATPEQVGDFSYLASGNPSEKHRRDDLVDRLILSPVACQNGAVTRSRIRASGQTQPPIGQKRFSGLLSGDPFLRSCRRGVRS